MKFLKLTKLQILSIGWTNWTPKIL